MLLGVRRTLRNPENSRYEYVEVAVIVVEIILVVVAVVVVLSRLIY